MCIIIITVLRNYFTLYEVFSSLISFVYDMCQFPRMVSLCMSSKNLVLIRSLIRRKRETISETLCGVVCSVNGRRSDNIGNGINIKPLSKILLFQHNLYCHT